MKISIISIGKIKKSPELDIINKYNQRLMHKIKFHEIADIKSNNKSQAQKLYRESILNILPSNSILVVLDEKGENINTQTLATKLSNFNDIPNKSIFFAIGGAYGFDKEIKDKANLVLSLGKLTWPHMLARAMIVEQIYRCIQILDNHPYHKI